VILTERNVQMADKQAPLAWDVYVTEPEPTLDKDVPPGASGRVFSPTSATLIFGERDAVLVDALLTVAQADALAEWVAGHGKNLKALYVTHGHADHWFGLSVILGRFPQARAFALPQVVDRTRSVHTPELITSAWEARFRGKLPETLVYPEPLAGGRLELEGHELVAMDVGHTDTDVTTILHAPDIGLVVAGDAAYNGVHQYLAESDHQSRAEWIAALDTIEALRPRAVIAGHKRADRADDPRIVEETRQYIRDFDRIAESSATARELYDQVLALHPDRVNPGAVWASAVALKPDDAATTAR
jgi:glyoxylase-like metal-dependent hydrolase (beta-lactamase superfamily II)